MSLKCKGLFIIGAKRTPFCELGGPLRDLPASHAFAAAAKDAIRSAGLDPSAIDNTVVGNVHFLSQCDGGKTPRYCGSYSGVSLDKPALGVNKACATGIQAIITSGVDILTGAAKVSLTGGTEIMSALPHLVKNARFGTTLGANYLFEDYLKTEFIDSYSAKSVQTLAEYLAKKFKVTREYADEFVLNSHLKWKSAQDLKIFDDEITSLTVSTKRKYISVDKDEIPQPDINASEILQTPPLTHDGTIITRNNISTPADGASALILANKDVIKQQNLTPLVKISGWACVGVAPEEFGLGALNAVNKLLSDHKLTVNDIDLFEINETFATEVLITTQELNVDPGKVNVSGGALCMGHPVAATGARMVTHLSHQISQRRLKRAIAASSAGGGQGVALLLEAV